MLLRFLRRCGIIRREKIKSADRSRSLSGWRRYMRKFRRTDYCAGRDCARSENARGGNHERYQKESGVSCGVLSGTDLCLCTAALRAGGERLCAVARGAHPDLFRKRDLQERALPFCALCGRGGDAPALSVLSPRTGGGPSAHRVSARERRARHGQRPSAGQRHPAPIPRRRAEPLLRRDGARAAVPRQTIQQRLGGSGERGRMVHLYKLLCGQNARVRGVQGARRAHRKDVPYPSDRPRPHLSDRAFAGRCRGLGPARAARRTVCGGGAHCGRGGRVRGGTLRRHPDLRFPRQRGPDHSL